MRLSRGKRRSGSTSGLFARECSSILNPDGNSHGVEEGIVVKLLLISWVFVGSVIKTGKYVAIGGEDVTTGLALHPESIKQTVRKIDRKE